MIEEDRVLHIDRNGIICPICSECGAYKEKRVSSSALRVVWTCSKCGTKNTFRINRRFGSRRKQYGKMAKILKNNNDIPILIDDLSIGGLSFRRDVGLKVGDKFMLLFPIEFRKNMESNVKITVKMRMASVSKNGRCGAEFLNLDDETKKKIGFWLMVD